MRKYGSYLQHYISWLLFDQMTTQLEYFILLQQSINTNKGLSRELLRRILLMAELILSNCCLAIAGYKVLYKLLLLSCLYVANSLKSYAARLFTLLPLI